MTPSRFGLVVIGAVLAGVPAEAAPFVVDSNLDTADVVLDGTCDADPGVPVVCTLRAAIQESNFGGVGNTITFNITPLGGVKTIAVNSTGLGGLPTITRAVTINGYTQGVASPNSLAVGSNAVLLIELNGAATGAGINGLTIAAPTTVRGLVINRFAGDGIQVNAGGATSVIAGNYVGTNAAGTAALGNNRDGVGFEAGISLCRRLEHDRRDSARRSQPGLRPDPQLLARDRALQFERQHDPGELRRHERCRHRGSRQRRRGDRDRRRPGSRLRQQPHRRRRGRGRQPLLRRRDRGHLRLGRFGRQHDPGEHPGSQRRGHGGDPECRPGHQVQSPGNTVGGDTPAKGNVISGNTLEGIRIEGAAATGNAIVGNRIYGNGALGIDLGPATASRATTPWTPTRGRTTCSTSPWSTASRSWGLPSS